MIIFLFLNNLQLLAICLFMPKHMTIVAFSLKSPILRGIGSGRYILAITLGTGILLLDTLLLIGSCIIKILYLLTPIALGSHHRNIPGSSLLHILLLLSEDGNHLFNGPLLILSIITRSNIVKLRRQSPHDQPNNMIRVKLHTNGLNLIVITN